MGMLKDLGQILNKTFAKHRYRPGGDVDTIILLKNWEHIVGEKLYSVSLPQRIFKETLYIIVNHSAYAHHLKQVSDQILLKIESLYPNYRNKVKQLRFVFSEQAFEEIKQSIPKESQAPKIKELFNPRDPKFRTLYAQAEQLFIDMPDDDLKESFISLYIQEHMKN